MIHQNTNKPEFEEIISRYIDGETTERERTEIKRLAANDPEFAQQIATLKNQKALLNNMPVQQAPSWLMDEIKISLERKLLLNDQPEFQDEVAGHRNLLYKRMTAAAIVFVLFGSFAFMVFQAFTPAKDLGKEPIAANPNHNPIDVVQSERQDTLIDEAYRDELPVFTASLELSSTDPVGMNNYLNKIAYIYDLENNIFKDTQDTKTSYHVTADIKQVRSLINELAVVWEQCQTTKLTVFGLSDENNIVLDTASASQVAAIFKQDSSTDRIDVANNFADFNAVVATQQERNSYAERLAARTAPLTPERPELTTGEKPDTNSEQDTNTEKVNLTITITAIPKE